MRSEQFSPNDTPPKYLDRTAAADYIAQLYGFPCSRQWLAKLAVSGDGPLFRKAGRYPVYRPEDLDAWAASRITQPRRSSADSSKGANR